MRTRRSANSPAENGAQNGVLHQNGDDQIEQVYEFNQQPATSTTNEPSPSQSTGDDNDQNKPVTNGRASRKRKAKTTIEVLAEEDVDEAPRKRCKKTIKDASRSGEEDEQEDDQAAAVRLCDPVRLDRPGPEGRKSARRYVACRRGEPRWQLSEINTLGGAGDGLQQDLRTSSGNPKRITDSSSIRDRNISWPKRNPSTPRRSRNTISGS